MTRMKQNTKHKNKIEVRKDKRENKSTKTTMSDIRNRKSTNEPDRTQTEKNNWFYSVHNNYILQIFLYSVITLFLSIVSNVTVGVSFTCGIIAGAQVHNIYTSTPIGRMQVISGLTGVGIAIILLKFIQI